VVFLKEKQVQFGEDGEQDVYGGTEKMVRISSQFQTLVCLQLLGFWTFPLSSILETRKHDVSETGSVSIPITGD
jgi:hypothetical protein